MKRWGWVGFLGVIMLSCATVSNVIEPAGLVEVQPEAQSVTQQPLPSPTKAISAEDAPQSPLIVPSGEAAAYNGQWVIVRIERAYCSYHPGIDGQPTFCNDQPYPDHDFTLLVWEQDWSYMDGACLLVRGQVEMFEGKAEIIATSPNQVSECE